MFRCLPAPRGNHRATFAFADAGSSSGSTSTALLPIAEPGHAIVKSALVGEVVVAPLGEVDVTTTIINRAHGGAQTAHTRYDDTVPLKTRYPRMPHHFPRPSRDDPDVQATIDDTRNIIAAILAKTSNPTTSTKSDKPTTMKIAGHEVQVLEYKVDPLLPPQFKLAKNRHAPPPPPPPLLKPTTDETLTPEERQQWQIPLVVSNWKNNLGFNISLEHRTQMLASADASVNVEGFGALNRALDDADTSARQRLAENSVKAQQQAQREREAADRELDELAQFVRRQRQPDDRRKRSRHQ